jgi:hypothetical protein
MVVNDLDIRRTWRAFRPLEADSPLVIDADTVLPGSVTFERFQPIASQGAEYAEAACCAEDSQPFPSLVLDPV